MTTATDDPIKAFQQAADDFAAAIDRLSKAATECTQAARDANEAFAQTFATAKLAIPGKADPS